MAWVRFDNGIGNHRKALELSDKHYLAALGLLLVCVGYCDSQRTDGFIPAKALRRIADGDYKTPLGELVRVGFLEETPDGYQVHDYLDWQQSAEQIEEYSRSQSEKAKRKAELDRIKRAAASADGGAAGDAAGDAKRQDETIQIDRKGPNDLRPLTEDDLSGLRAVARGRLTEPQVALLARQYGRDTALEAVRRTRAREDKEPVSDFYRLASGTAENIAKDLVPSTSRNGRG